MLGASVALSPVSAVNFLLDDDGDDAGTPGTLRHAIAQANGNTEEDTITIDPSVFFIALLDDGPLVISSTDKITIDASGVTNGVAISGFDGNGLGFPSRVIEVDAGASLELVGVEITDGKAADGDDGVDGAVPTDGGDGGDGGGNFNEGTLVLRDCKIVFNEAGDGGDAGNKTDTGAGSAGLAGNGGQGGGIWEGDNGGGGIGFGGRGVTNANSIVCLNQAGTDPNIEIGFLFDGNNLVGVNPDPVACPTQTCRVALSNKLESILAQPDPSAIFWNAAAGS